VSNQPEQLKDLKNELEKTYQVATVTFNLDLALESSPQQLFELCNKNNYFVEVLINNAGTLIFGEAVKVDFYRTKSILNLHVTTPVLLCRLFSEQMLKHGKGFILNVSSISSVMPYPTISLYGPTKAFIRYYSRALRTELREFGINVTCLLPGATLTSLYNAGKFNTPLMKRLGIVRKPENVARVAIKALFRNRAECIPGLINKLVLFLLPLVPYFIIRCIYRKTRFSNK